jgi:hypothetical protein
MGATGLLDLPRRGQGASRLQDEIERVDLITPSKMSRACQLRRLAFHG